MSSPVTNKEIQDYVRSNLASYKSLTGGIKRVESIPESASGKVLRKILSEAAKSEMAEEVDLKRPPVSLKTRTEHGRLRHFSFGVFAYYVPLLTTVAVFASCWCFNDTIRLS